MVDKYNKSLRNREIMLLLRFACERLARSCYVRAKGSTVRILARKIEAAAYGAIVDEFSDTKGERKVPG